MTNHSQAQINQNIPMLNPQIKDYYSIQEKNFTFNHQQYRIFIAKPTQQNTKSVLYVLDGNAQFPLAINAVDPNKPLPLIVGLGYPENMAYPIERRTWDYTFATEGGAFQKGGGATLFLQFIQQQVIPFIQQEYVKSPAQQVLVGHSFGGLFALYTLFHQGDLFSDYIIASPSLWWGKGEIIQQRPTQLANNIKYLHFTLGEYEQYPQRDPNITAERLERIQQRRQHMPVEEVVKLLQQQYSKPIIDFTIIPHKNHGGVIPDAINIAVQHIQQQD